MITDEDWHMLRDNIQYDFLQDGHFAELKESEMLMERLRVADSMRDYVGKYFSVEYVRKNVLDKQIEKLLKLIIKLRKKLMMVLLQCLIQESLQERLNNE